MPGSGSGQTPAQTTATSTPWAGAQPALGSLYGAAEGTYAGDVGYQNYPGNLQAPLNPNLEQGLYSQYYTALPELGVGSAGVQAARGLGLGMLQSGGLSPEQQAVIGQQQGNVGQFGGIYGRAGDVYNEASTQQNPYLLAQIAANDRRISDRVNSTMSGAGRYGSGAHTDVLGRSLAEAADPILAQDYAQRQQTRLAALQGQQSGAAGAGTALGNIAQTYGQGQQLAGQWAQMMPTLDELRYAPAEKIQQFGQFYTDRAQQDLANQVAQWNASQARPWEQLARYANLISGAGGLGGTKVTTSNPYIPSTLSRVGGGAIAGAGLGSMFGPVGSGAGALGGGLLGLFQ